MAVAISAISISVISLFVAIEHGATERKLVAASSWPFLVYDSQITGLVEGSKAITLRIRNSGVGPARIQSVAARLDGKPVRSFAELLSACCGTQPTDIDGLVKVGLYSENPIVGVLPAREGVDFLAVRQRPGNARLFDAFNVARHRLVFSVCYCSVLDECWRTDLKSTTTPQPVKQCPAVADGYTE